MPFSITDENLPEYIKSLSETKRSQWVKVWNSTFDACNEAGDSNCEEKAFRAANSVVSNQHIINSQKLSLRTEYKDDKKYIVVPMTAMIEGVYHGELVTQEQLAKHVEAWNGRPFVIHHAFDEQGNPTSVNTPDLLDKQRVGYVFNANVSGGKLTMEAWLEPERLETVPGGQLLIKLIQANEAVDVSTAYLRDYEKSSGVFNDKEYHGVSKNLKPDHVAAILEGRGECSQNDGCGLLVNDGEDDEMKLLVLDENDSIIKKFLNFITNNGGNVMGEKRKAILDAGLAFNEEEITEMCDEKVNSLYQLLANKEKEIEDEDESVVDNENDNDTEEQTLDIEDAVVKALDTALKSVGGLGGLAETVKGLKANSAKEKSAIVDAIIANGSSIPREDLLGLNKTTLEALQRDTKAKDYTGNSPVANIKDNEDFVAFDVPTVWEK